MYRVVKIDMKSIARTIRKEASVVLCQNSPESFEFDFYRVIGRSVWRSVKSETHYKYPSINWELNAIATTSVTPLVWAVRAWLETVAYLQTTMFTTCLILNTAFTFTWLFNPARGFIGYCKVGLLLAVKWKNISMVSCWVKMPFCAAPLANSSNVIVGIRIMYRALPSTARLFWGVGSISLKLMVKVRLWETKIDYLIGLKKLTKFSYLRIHSAVAQFKAASKRFISLQFKVSLPNTDSNVDISISTNPSDFSAISACLNSTKQIIINSLDGEKIWVIYDQFCFLNFGAFRHAYKMIWQLITWYYFQLILMSCSKFYASKLHFFYEI